MAGTVEVAAVSRVGRAETAWSEAELEDAAEMVEMEVTVVANPAPRRIPHTFCHTGLPTEGHCTARCQALVYPGTLSWRMRH